MAYCVQLDMAPVTSQPGNQPTDMCVRQQTPCTMIKVFLNISSNHMVLSYDLLPVGNSGMPLCLQLLLIYVCSLVFLYPALLM